MDDVRLGPLCFIASASWMDKMDIANVDGRTLNEICRQLKRRRASDGFSYRAYHAGQNDPTDPATWDLPVYHGASWNTALSIVRYLRAFPRYRDALLQFSIDPNSIFAEDGTVAE
jgi:hypothetical protein